MKCSKYKALLYPYMEVSVLRHTSQKQPTVTIGWASEPLWTWRWQQVLLLSEKTIYQAMNLASSPDRKNYEAEFLNRYLFVAPSEPYLSVWSLTLRRCRYFTSTLLVYMLEYLTFTSPCIVMQL
jgi:hypothetical protein